MELRKKVNRPQRYEPEIDDAGRAERYIPPLNRPIFPTSFIEYNPILRPAAFPTLHQAQTALSEQDHAPERSNTKSRQQADIIPIAERTLAQTNTATTGPSAQTEVRAGNTPASAAENDNLGVSNCRHNPVYVRNLKLLYQYSQRTEHEWNIQEMDTSDEELLQEHLAASRPVRPH